MPDPIATYKSIGTTVTIYPNRLEIQRPGIFAAKITIPFRNIASIQRPSLLNRIDIKTNDGKTQTITMLNPTETMKIKDQIESLL